MQVKNYPYGCLKRDTLVMKVNDIETSKFIFNNHRCELVNSYKEEEFETYFKCI